MSLPIDELVRRLRLAPHPEGGWFRELYRDAAVTTIYYAMEPRGLSPLHRLRTRSELWHFYSGAAVDLHTIVDAADDPVGDGRHDVARLDAESPLAVVPPGVWQSARVLGDEPALLGCTVAPAFDFSDWQMPPRAELLRRFPALAALVTELTRP